MQHFTPFPALLGGILLGIGASALMLFNGRIAGISGIFGGLVVPKARDLGWRAAFVLGLLAGGALFLLVHPAAFPAAAPRSLPVIALAGLLVGYGTRLGGGCTSGHGVCGLSRFSVRSLVATMTFMIAGIATVFVSAHVVGGLL